MWSISKDFLDESGIHGLSYIHPRNSIISQAFWIICVILGFTTAGLFLKDAFHDWEDMPVMTTLDSIAAPINMIQFPTVTICQDEYKPPDNWAFLETILNNIAFECSTDDDENLPLCEKTSKIRNDFEDVIQSVVQKFRAWLMNPEYHTTSVYDVLSNITGEDHASLNIDNVINDIENQLVSLMEMGKLSWNDLSELINDKFAVRESILLALKSLSKEIDYDEYYYQDIIIDRHPAITCNTTKCEENVKLIDQTIRFLRIVMNIETKQPFGSFLASFAQLSNEFGYFDSNKDLGENYFNTLHHGEVDCKNADGNKYQEYFKQLSKIVGFTENELVSLYDLPAIVASLEESKLLKPNFAQLFYYTRCQTMSDWTSKKIEDTIKSCIHSWKTFVEYPSELHPCNQTIDQLNGKCCHSWTKRMGNNLKAVMKVMRLANGRGKSRLDIKELFQMSKPYLYYNLRKEVREFDSNHFVTDINSIIPWCEIKDEKSGPKNLHGGEGFTPDSCNLFHPIITDTGLCHSFNAKSTVELLKPSYFKESFVDAFSSDIPANQTVRNGTSSGPKHALNFYLMGNNFHRRLDENPSHFYIGLSDQNDYFDMKSIGQDVKPGYETIWKVHAMEIVPSDDLRDVPIEKRKCRFQDENEGLEIFKQYSQTACEFECRIKKAEDVCGCYPWYIPPYPKSTQHIICDVYGNFCFKEITKRVYAECLKNCVPNCHQIEFTHTHEHIARDPDSICKKYWWSGVGYSLENEIVKDIMDKGHYNSLIYKYSKISEWVKRYKNSNMIKEFNVTINKWGEKKAQMELCQILVKDHMAKVSVMFDRKKYVRTLTSLKATFSDRLANVGGTLGLFTGMSILSMIEIVFWVFKCIFYSLRCSLTPQSLNSS